MQLLVELVLLARSLVDLARSAIEVHGARKAKGNYIPKHMGRRRSGRTRNKEDRL